MTANRESIDNALRLCDVMGFVFLCHEVYVRFVRTTDVLSDTPHITAHQSEETPSQVTMTLQEQACLVLFEEREEWNQENCPPLEGEGSLSHTSVVLNHPDNDCLCVRPYLSSSSD